MTPPWKAPRVWKPRDVLLTADVLNRELRDKLLYLYDTLTGAGTDIADLDTRLTAAEAAITDITTVEAWIPMAGDFEGTWANAGAPEADGAYCKDALGFVHLRGAITGDTSGSLAFILPVGYRPAVRVRVAVVPQGGNAAYLRIDTNGEIRPTGPPGWASSSYIALDSSFRID